jgi:hypothetical protein
MTCGARRNCPPWRSGIGQSGRDVVGARRKRPGRGILRPPRAAADKWRVTVDVVMLRFLWVQELLGHFVAPDTVVLATLATERDTRFSISVTFPRAPPLPGSPTRARYGVTHGGVAARRRPGPGGTEEVVLGSQAPPCPAERKHAGAVLSGRSVAVAAG